MMFAPRYSGKANTALHRSSSTWRDHEADGGIRLSEAERKELAAQKFDEWVRFKDSFDRGLALFTKLDPRHCENEKAWQRVAVILAAIDRSLGNDLKVNIYRGKRQGSTKAKAGLQNMFDAFKKWTMSGHTFTFVKLDAAEVESLGPATRQFLEPEDAASEAATVLPSLTYNFPPPPARRGLRTRPLTDDQKALNTIFLRRVRAGWDTANFDMRDQLAKYVEEAEMTYQAKRRKALHIEDVPVCQQHLGRAVKGGSKPFSREGDRGSKGEEEEKRGGREERKQEEGKSEEGKDDNGDDETKPKDDEEEDNGAARASEEPSDDNVNQQGDVAGSRVDSYGLEKGRDEGLRARRSRFVNAGLVAVGIRRLSELLEEDVDRRKKKENDDRLEKEEEARRAHEGWTRVKDARRFRLPDEEPFRPGGVWKPPRFDFSGGKGLVRPNKNQIASTTLDIMRGQGLKYVHAITDGRQGMEGDLEKSKRKIKRYNETVIKEGKRRAAARQAEKTKAFKGWTRLKEMKEASVRCLRAIDPPEQNGKPGASEHWLEVGCALKSVDVHLSAEWTAWTGTSFPVAHCQAVWDALSPKSCDTHSTSYSATRETFLKLLRPGLNYREAFHKVVRRRLRREGTRIDDDDEVDKNDLVITRRELRGLLTKELGIVLRPEEMRRLMDAFDTNENRCIGWEEFENLTGGVRDAVRGDSAKRLKRHCVWETMCPVTGMPNAYTVCAVKETDRVGSRKDQRDGRPNAAAAESTTATVAGGRVGGAPSSEIITLRSGDRRRRNELADRGKRLRILSKYGLATPPGETKEKKGRGGGARGEYDDDGFEAAEDDDESYQEEEFEKRSDGEGRNSPPRERSACELSAWTVAKRMAGLKTLKRLSRANREAEELRHLLAEGTTPGPPKLWSAKPGHPDVGEDDDALTEELLLCWRPQPGSVVAFFSLEISGPEGGKMFCHGTHREICRDPPDAGGAPEYQHWVQGLFPNTRYGFRVRAFNGFGPGSYAHGCFTTRPARPAQPIVTRATPTEICLQWVFGNKFAAKLRELRQAFDTLDEQDDGEVVRDEFLASLDLDHPQLMAMLKGSPAAMGTEAAAVGPETASVFDALEANDDEFVCWEEIERHFAHVSRGARNAEHRCGGELAQRKGRGSGGGNFILEMCTSQESDRWKEVWKGTTGTARVKTLEPGQCYRFRVRAANCEGHEGTASDSMVAHTLLVTPAALRVNGGSGRVAAAGVLDNRVRLRWGAAIGGSAVAPSSVGGNKKAAELLPFGGGGGGRRTTVDREAARILTQWVNEGSEDRGVNVEMEFTRFDRHRRGVIDPLELGNVLEALGVEVTEERLREAFTELIPGCSGGAGTDAGTGTGTGTVEHPTGGALSLEDFEAWWNNSETTFALLRDNGVSGNLLEMAAARGDPLKQESTASINITSFKGRGHGCEVAGLMPNTLYRFRVRALNNRTRSSLSAPLVVMTAPRQPDPPVVIRSQQRSIVLKWYSGPGGACKYLLQARLLEGLDGIRALAHEGNRPLSSGGVRKKAWGAATGENRVVWATVYEGVDSTAKATGLAANSVYRFRVRGINLRGVPSEWSFTAQAATSQRCGGEAGERNTPPLYKPQCAAEVFNEDADDDIVVGDTIIFTERLYVDMYGDPIPTLTGAGSTGTSNTTPRAVLGTASGINGKRGRRIERGRPATARVAVGGAGQAMPLAAGGGGAEFVGERTVAAHVLQDSFRSMRRKAKRGVLEYSRATSINRVLRLEVVWSTVSREEVDTFILPRGSIVERSEGCLSEFETFRALWEEDDRRKSVREEWALFSGVSS